MTKFIAYINQTNNGCDYTVACGKVLWELKASNYDKALAELRHKIAPSLDMDEPIYELESVILYQIVNETVIPLKEWYADRAAEEEVYDKQWKLDSEMAEYRRLQEKYGK